MRSRLSLIVLLASAFAALVLPGSSLGAGSIPEIHKGVLADKDARKGSLGPTAEQLALVSSLGATATWNKFGTPQSLTKHGGYLVEGLAGDDAASAARAWVDANETLFRLTSTGSLKLDHATNFPHSNAYAVYFRQEFGGLRAAEDGLVTVGIGGSKARGWKVNYVSSSISPNTNLSGQAVLSPVDAWLRAAADVSRATSIVEVGNVKTDREWSVFAANGFSHPQRARLVALPRPGTSARRVYETLLIDNRAGASMAFVHYVDAANGAVLLRRNVVHQAQEVQQTHPTVATFTGEVSTATDGACDADKGPWVVLPTEDVDSIVVAVEAELTLNDSVIHLKADDVIVASQDTLFSPEALVYAPSGGVPPASYEVQVCDFSDGVPWDEPNDYAGVIFFNSVVGPGVPYPPKWNVFPANPLLNDVLGFPWGNESTDIRDLWCWEHTVQGSPVAGCEPPGFELQNLASRVPWDFNPDTEAPTFTTFGNNANSAESWSSPLTPGVFGHHPIDAGREYDFPWTNHWYESSCDPTDPDTFTPQTPIPTLVSNDISPAVTNLFAMHNRMHDWAYFLGFTEENWNAQLNNFGNSGMDNDPLEGDAQAGAATGGFPTYLGRDNANMITLPDGVPSITNMYLWQPLRGAFYPPCVDGDYDMAVIGHEFTHMTENRMIGKGGTRGGHHAGAMGESTADFQAMEYLNEYSFVPVDGENPYSVGAYATGQPATGIRNYGMNMSPLNFSNMGYDITGPQVHADGEIWSATNFAIRERLIDKYDSKFPATDAALQKKCADGQKAPEDCPGNRRWIQLYFDAMLLMPTAPSMVEARDAMLAADVARFGSANQLELWRAFAQRGFGEGAESSNTTANTDTDPKPDFASPLDTNATATFNALAADEGDAAITNARIYVGHYEARTSPVADTDPTTDASPGVNNLDNVAEFAPGRYDFVAHAPGYGHVRFTRNFNAGQVVTLNIKFGTNWASSANGATAAGDGVNHGNLIDETEGTQWSSTGSPVAGKQVVVDLADTDPRVVNRVQVSALLFTGQNRFTALRQFEIHTCDAGNAGNPTCLGSLYPTGFTKILTSADDAFPGDVPRPLAPNMILRSFPIPANTVPLADRTGTHVMIRVLTNQCTGQPHFQGIQDADVTNVTDCRTTPVPADPVPPGSLAPQDTAVRIAELQVFTRTGGAGVPQDPVVVLTKIGPVAAAPGQTITYSLDYTNAGPFASSKAKIVDALPEGVAFVSATDGGKLRRGKVTWNLGTVAVGSGGSVSVTVRVSPSAAAGDVLLNQAEFTAPSTTATPAVWPTMVLPAAGG